MTDASLRIFSVDAQEKRIQPIEGKQRPIEGRRRPSGVQNPPFLGVFSATQPHKGNRIIETYGAGDGNRTHVRSLGSRNKNLKTLELAAPSVVRHTDGRLLRAARPRFTFSRISEALAVQINGLGSLLCCSRETMIVVTSSLTL